MLAVLLAGAAPVAAATVAISAARMLDVVSGQMVANPVIVSVDGRITAIGPAGSVAIPADAQRIDLAGMTILPGLIDMHVHLTSDPTTGYYSDLEHTPTFSMVVGVANAGRTLDAGFTTVRNVGSADYGDVGLKQGIEAGFARGPRIVPAGYALGATGGHCDDNRFPPNIVVDRSGVASGPQGFREKVREVHKFGADVIKFCATGGVFSARDTVDGQQLTQEEMDALVDEAHRLRMKVAVHAHGTDGIKAAIRAGADTIEHASLADAEAFELAKKAGTAFSMDIYNDDYILAEGAKNGVPEANLAKERAIGLKQRQTFQAAHKAGVKMVFGSDAGVYPHGDNGRQFAKMTEWGMTPLQAIRAATLNAGEALGMATDVGTLAVGRYADIIAVAGDPIADISQLQKVKVVIKGGTVAKDAR
ncbi:MAG: Xaa-Pro dipeptidase [Alphaproteobacteria bacterium PA4]|nr:MAG: Xaa-Pro dipeptidase [Alphaproteobacteria bacterium PA4]